MSFLCGYSAVSLSSFILFLWFQSPAPHPTLTPPIWSTFASTPLFHLQSPLPFSKRELRFCTCAALPAGALLHPPPSRQRPLKDGFKPSLPLRHKRWFGHSVTWSTVKSWRSKRAPSNLVLLSGKQPGPWYTDLNANAAQVFKYQHTALPSSSHPENPKLSRGESANTEDSGIFCFPSGDKMPHNKKLLSTAESSALTTAD